MYGVGDRKLLELYYWEAKVYDPLLQLEDDLTYLKAGEAVSGVLKDYRVFA